jgi:FtsP/CotA-like multicopper oxidase with cupredoxin domain
VNATGHVLREFTIIIKENVPVQISENPTHVHDAWTFNGTVPGPTIRVTEGDHVKINVINLENNTLSHSMHMHSIHPSEMDGVQANPILPGGNFTYDFIAQPAGVYPYHCHIDPLHDHINRGLYGALIIDPKTPRPAMPEMMMMLNGYDLDYDQEGPTIIRPGEGEAEEEVERGNEIYTANGYAFGYMMHPIHLEAGKPYRIYVVNMLEFDLINTFHVHGALFDYYPSGIGETPAFTNDIIDLGQGDRGIMEVQYTYPGKYMFHAHVTEFTDLGWMGFFEVHEP